jgi:hypothetical protein
MDESKAFTLILTQVFILLGIVIAVLSVAVFYFKKKAATESSNSPTSSHLDKDSSSSDTSDEEHSITSAKGNDAWMLRKFLEEEINACSEIYNSLSGEPISEKIPIQTNKKLVAIFVRYTYLKTELAALESRNDPGPFWNILVPKLLTLCAIYPPESVKKTIRNIKSQISTIEQENKRLNLLEETFFSLQKLLRDSLPDNVMSQLLPLTQEVELLKTGSSTDKIIAYYKDAFDLFKDHVPAHCSTTPSNKASNDDILSLNKITKDQSENISILEAFLTELHEQNTLPAAQLNKYHNFIIDLKEQLSNTEQFVTGLDRKLREAEMCTNLLETELDAAQETIRGLMANVEENKPANSANNDSEKVKDLEALVTQFTRESRDMLLSIQMLQDENNELRSKVDNAID